MPVFTDAIRCPALVVANTDTGHGSFFAVSVQVLASPAGEPGPGVIEFRANITALANLHVVDNNDEDALLSESGSANHAAVAGHNSGGGIGVFGSGKTGGDFPGDSIGILASGAQHAGQFNGHVQVNGGLDCTGDLSGQTLHAHQDVLLGSDCAEDFDIASDTDIEPGTVMVLDDNGALRQGDDPVGALVGRGQPCPSRRPDHARMVACGGLTGRKTTR